MRTVLLLAILAGANSVSVGEEASSGQGSGAALNVNPIRRVVTMLQMMQKKIDAEEEKETELYDKFMCYCENGAGALQASVAAAETKIPQVESSLESKGAEKAQLGSDIVQHKA